MQGRVAEHSIIVQWTEPFGARHSAGCGHQTSDDDGQDGIWFLDEHEDGISLSGVEDAWCNGPLSLDMRKVIVDRILKRRTWWESRRKGAAVIPRRTTRGAAEARIRAGLGSNGLRIASAIIR